MYWRGEEDWLGPDTPDFYDAVGNQDSFLVALRQKDFSVQLDVLHALFGLRSRAWRKDYFTSALPFVQKGPDVMLPLSGVVDFAAGESGDVRYSKDGLSGNPPGLYVGASGYIQGTINGSQLGPSIQDVRTAFRLEEMYEADGRFGSRYPENMLGQFGVRTPDSRLPRCQFLGSNLTPVQIQQVIQTSATSQQDETPQGNLAGLSTSYGSNRLCKTYQTQHGFIVC